MAFELAEAKDVLRIDGTDNDRLIESLIRAAVDHVRQATGLNEEEQQEEPQADTVKGMLVTLWYFADHSDDMKLQRIINGLLCSLSARAAEIRAEKGSGGE